MGPLGAAGFQLAAPLRYALTRGRTLTGFLHGSHPKLRIAVLDEGMLVQIALLGTLALLLACPLFAVAAAERS